MKIAISSRIKVVLLVEGQILQHLQSISILIYSNNSKQFDQGGPYLTFLLFYTGSWNGTPIGLLWKSPLSFNLTLTLVLNY